MVVDAPVVTGLLPHESAVRASIIIVNYNGGRLLWRCLETLAGTLGADTEVIVVDNASTDGSADRLEQIFPGTRTIAAHRNDGFGAGNNLGARSAQGDYLVFLNPDTQVTPGWLEGLLAPLEADPTVGLTTAKIVLADNRERVNACGNDVHLTGLTLCRGLGEASADFTRIEDVSAVSGAAFAMRRALFEDLGGFDEAFFLYMEDTDLSLRARLAGWRCVVAPRSVVAHEYRLHFGPRKVFYQESNRYRLLLKILRWPTLLMLLPALILAEVVTWGFVLVSDRTNLGNKWRAYLETLLHWGQIASLRRQTQALRRVPDRALLRLATSKLNYAQTGRNVATRVASLIFDPLFWAWRRLTLAITWW